MKLQIVALAAGVLIFDTAGAEAQTADPSSLVDHKAAAVVGGPGTAYSPGTVGAMNAVVHGVATSPEDVRRQEEGRSTAMDGDRRIPGLRTTSVVGHSPGTVGAMPGNDD